MKSTDALWPALGLLEEEVRSGRVGAIVTALYREERLIHRLGLAGLS